MKIFSIALYWGIAFAWILWFSVQGKWSEVVAPNIWLLIVITSVITVVTVLLSSGLRKRKQSEELVVRPVTGQLIAREIVTTTVRDRRLYAESK